jgi:hypothetical protein
MEIIQAPEKQATAGYIKIWMIDMGSPSLHQPLRSRPPTKLAAEPI